MELADTDRDGVLTFEEYLHSYNNPIINKDGK